MITLKKLKKRKKTEYLVCGWQKQFKRRECDNVGLIE